MKTHVALTLGLFFTFLQPTTWAQSVEVAEASIADLQKAMTEGRTTSKTLVQAYLNRIDAFDTHGPKLNSLIALNPNALKEAEALDRERAAKGPRGPLHGIPIIVKDNYDTADMPTTAGTIALLGHVPPRDAFQVQKLREAGAVIIGKSNLHELASGIVTISSAGGQTLNPYDPTRNPGGSSGGTGAAIAASLAAAGMGSDTCGSIRIPSSHNNLVGLRPTKGLSSISGIIPLSVTQDVGGPLARTVSDLAVVLDATIGEDPADPFTKLKAGQTRPKFADALRADALSGARVGALEPLFGEAPDDQEVIRIVRAGIEELKKQGVTVVSVPMPELTGMLTGSSVIDLEMRDDLASYLATSGTPPVHSLAEILEKGWYHASLEGTLKRRQGSKGRDSDEYRSAVAKRIEVQKAILKVLDDYKLDALVYPTIRRKAARISEPQPGSTCQLSATTGFPAISVPTGFTTDGLPVGMELLARAFDDAKLVSFAYAYEQSTHHRQAPALTPALGGKTSVSTLTWESTGNGSAGRSVRARFSFNPSTNELQYNLTATGFRPSEILGATLHRGAQNQTGPVIALLSNHSFSELSGSHQLSNADRDRLTSRELYLNVTNSLSTGGSIRIPLDPK